MLSLPTQPWAEKIMVNLEWCLLTPLNCIWKRNCTALISFIISDSILRIVIWYSYYSVFMFLPGVYVSRSPYISVETYWILCELSIEMYFFSHKCNLLERARLWIWLLHINLVPHFICVHFVLRFFHPLISSVKLDPLWTLNRVWVPGQYVKCTYSSVFGCLLSTNTIFYIS